MHCANTQRGPGWVARTGLLAQIVRIVIAVTDGTSLSTASSSPFEARNATVREAGEDGDPGNEQGLTDLHPSASTGCASHRDAWLDTASRPAS